MGTPIRLQDLGQHCECDEDQGQHYECDEEARKAISPQIASCLLCSEEEEDDVLAVDIGEWDDMEFLCELPTEEYSKRKSKTKTIQEVFKKANYKRLSDTTMRRSSSGSTSGYVTNDIAKQGQSKMEDKVEGATEGSLEVSMLAQPPLPQEPLDQCKSFRRRHMQEPSEKPSTAASSADHFELDVSMRPEAPSLQPCKPQKPKSRCFVRSSISLAPVCEETE